MWETLQALSYGYKSQILGRLYRLYPTDISLSDTWETLQALSYGYKSLRYLGDYISVNVDGYELTNSSQETLLGIAIDNKLRFDVPVSKLCKKASQKLHALARVSRYEYRETPYNYECLYKFPIWILPPCLDVSQ